jgi:membrane protein CcdC involved in cytochrome C biogenesis
MCCVAANRILRTSGVIDFLLPVMVRSSCTSLIALAVQSVFYRYLLCLSRISVKSQVRVYSILDQARRSVGTNGLSAPNVLLVTNLLTYCSMPRNND